MKQYMADGMLLVTAIVWGSGFVITAIALEYLTAYQVMAGRFILAAIILTTIFGYRLKKSFKISNLERDYIRHHIVHCLCTSDCWFTIYNPI